MAGLVCCREMIKTLTRGFVISSILVAIVKSGLASLTQRSVVPVFDHHQQMQSTTTARVDAIDQKRNLEVQYLDGEMPQRPLLLRPLTIVRPFSVSDSDKLLTSFDLWGIHLPCAAANSAGGKGVPSVNVDLVLYFSQDLHSEDERSLRILERFKSFFLHIAPMRPWSKCFRSIRVADANIASVLDRYYPTKQDTDPLWNSGPNRQFIDIVRKIRAGATIESGSNTFYYMEPDAVPQRSLWLEDIINEVLEKQPFAVLGSNYLGHNWDGFRESLPAALQHHINGNALYNVSHSTFERIFSTFADEPSKEGRSSFDVRLCEILLNVLSPSMLFEAGYKLSNVMANFAGTITLPRHLRILTDRESFLGTGSNSGATYPKFAIVHGAKYHENWPASTESISLVVSDWGLMDSTRGRSHHYTVDRVFEQLAFEHDAGRLPFSSVVTITFDKTSYWVQNLMNSVMTNDTRSSLDVVVGVRGRVSSSWDLCTANISTKWFMVTDLNYLPRTPFELPVYQDKINIRPLTPYTSMASNYCNTLCKSRIVAARAQYVNFTFDVDPMYAVYHTGIRNQFCAALPRGTPPTPNRYFAFVIARGHSTLYKFYDRERLGTVDGFESRRHVSVRGRRAECVDIQGSYTCNTKNDGAEGGACIDNPCSNNGDMLATCTEIEGSDTSIYSCNCSAGYTGSGTYMLGKTEIIPVCLIASCAPFVFDTSVTAGDFETEYEGGPCVDGVILLAIGEESQCGLKCADGFTGSDAQLVCPESSKQGEIATSLLNCTPSVCPLPNADNGITYEKACVNITVGQVCEVMCSLGYRSDMPSEGFIVSCNAVNGSTQAELDYTQLPVCRPSCSAADEDGVGCLNGGTCATGFWGIKCSCPNGYSGSRCEFLENQCELLQFDPCQGHGDPLAGTGAYPGCVDNIAGYSCQCAPGYTGSSCEFTITNLESHEQNVGLLLPLYTYPNPSNLELHWKPSIQLASSISTYALLNPNNGDGNTCPLSIPWANGLMDLKRGAVKADNFQILGYTYTSNGQRDVAEVKAIVDNYYNCWSTSAGAGIFIDQVSIAEAHNSYYMNLYSYIQTLGAAGMTTVFLSPGTLPSGTEGERAEALMNFSDTLVVFNGDFDTLRAYTLPSWTSRYPATRFAGFVHGVSSDMAPIAVELMVAL